MDFKKYLAVGALGLALLVNGCSQKPVLSGNVSGNTDEIRDELKYVASIDVRQGNLKTDYLNENITVSPDGKLGVFAASKVPKGQLPKGQQVEYETYLILVDLLNGKVTLLDRGEYISPLQWSPQGDKILYRKDDNLYIIDKAGEAKHRIAVEAYCGTISPDGVRVAFVQRGKGLFVSGIDGSAVKKLTGDSGDWYPVWYPDSRTLFYFADRKVNLGDGAGKLQGLGRIDVETGQAGILIPEEKGKYRRAEWVIPGKTLLVNKGWDDGFYEMLVNLETRKVYQLGEISGSKTYSTTVDKARGLVYKAQGNKVTGIDADGREEKAFTLNQPQGLQFSRESGVAVSPDGKMLAYLSLEKRDSTENGVCQVWLANVDGSNPVKLTGDFNGFHAPVWTPDAKHVISVKKDNSSSGDRGFTVNILEISQ